MKFLITGVGGFVGRHFVEYLENAVPECQILGIDIMSECPFKSARFQYHYTDLCDAKKVSQIVQTFAPDYILHLAGISSVSQSWKNPKECLMTNMALFFNIVDAIKHTEIPCRILSIGSSEEYGDYPSDQMPLNEAYNLNPNSPYAIAKTSQEMLSKMYADSFGLDIMMTRSFNHIGPRQSDRFVISSFIRQLVAISKNRQKELTVGNITVTRDFLDVRDVVRAYYKILTSGTSGEVYNVCSGTGVKLSKIIHDVSMQLNITPQIIVDPARIRLNENQIIIGDNSKIKNLSWAPQYTLTDTLNDIIDYWDFIDNIENKGE